MWGGNQGGWGGQGQGNQGGWEDKANKVDGDSKATKVGMETKVDTEIKVDLTNP